MSVVLAVAAGGALGSVCRYYIGYIFAYFLGVGFPYGTLLVNAVGGFIILFFMTLFVERLSIDPIWRFFIVTGFLGGFTTFSSFTYETILMIEDREFSKALLNFALNNILAFAGGAFGFLLARSL